jgi:predicted  nucleic acid-binding Zn-ribbon protein
MDQKSLLMMMMEDYEKDINSTLKEIQGNTTNQVKELYKTIQDLKIEEETIKKSQRKTTLEIENQGKKSGAIDASISKRIQKMEERISGAEDSIANMHTVRPPFRDPYSSLRRESVPKETRESFLLQTHGAV